MATKKMNFEQNMERLDEIVRQLEGGTVSLEDGMKLFEEGTKISATLQKQLDVATQKISLMTDAGETVFEGDGNE